MFFRLDMPGHQTPAGRHVHRGLLSYHAASRGASFSATSRRTRSLSARANPLPSASSAPITCVIRRLAATVPARRHDARPVRRARSLVPPARLRVSDRRDRCRAHPARRVVQRRFPGRLLDSVAKWRDDDRHAATTTLEVDSSAGGWSNAEELRGSKAGGSPGPPLAKHTTKGARSLPYVVSADPIRQEQPRKYFITRTGLCCRDLRQTKAAEADPLAASESAKRYPSR